MFAARRIGLLGCIVPLVVACATASPPAPAFDVKACPAEWSGFAAECGEVRVPENYAAPDGRSIALNVVVLRATSESNDHDAQFELDGGPGLAVVETVPFYATDGAMYRRTRDIVFVDMRGTGGSNPLRCPAIERYEASDPWGAMYPPDLVARCAARLSADADLSQYTTSNAVRDLETVRAALGYERIALNALSYGTTLALAYIAEHPERVRAAVLTGSAPVDRLPPRHHATAASRALRKLFAACAAEASCHAAFPDPAVALQQAHARAASISAEHADIFEERLRTRLYSAPGARAAWPVAPSTPPSPTRPLRTPVLFVSGEYDPVTPPEWVDDLLPLFPNGRQIILPGGGHLVEGMSNLDTCYDPTIVAFLDSADAADLDAACIDSMRAPDFVTE